MPFKADTFRHEEVDRSIQSGTDGSSNINVTELSGIKLVSEPVHAKKIRTDRIRSKNDGFVDGVQDENDRRHEFFYNKTNWTRIIGGGGLLNVLGQFTPTGRESEAFGAVSGASCYRCPVFWSK